MRLRSGILIVALGFLPLIARAQVPANARATTWGKGWQCERGFREVSRACLAVVPPAHAEIDYSGHSWQCVRGYRRVEIGCTAVTLPDHAELDYSGHNWNCSRGYRRN